MDVVPALVAYHSIHWIRAAVESYLLRFPDDRLLVIDNNPRRGEEGWVPDCVRERNWLAGHPGVILVENPNRPDGPLQNRSHGAGVDLALDWCRDRGVEVLVHFEPDCVVTGTKWRENLLRALEDGAWMAGSVRQCHGPIHPTPTAWRVPEVRASFKIAPWKGRDEARPGFHELVHPEALEHDTSPMGVWIGWSRYWDTGHKAWFEAAILDKAALVETPGITHFWHGSIQQRCSEAALLSRYPELLPYLDIARARAGSPAVEHCPHRAERPGSPDVARCGLLREILGAVEPEWSEVRRNACVACLASFPPAGDELNPVVASLVFSMSDQVIRRGGVPGCDVLRATRLREQAESQLDLELR
jgi:hypothetical protein